MAGRSSWGLGELASEGEGQAAEAVDEGRLGLAFGLGAAGLDAVVAIEHGVEQLLGLQAGEGGPDAVVGSATEAEVVPDVAS